MNDTVTVIKESIQRGLLIFDRGDIENLLDHIDIQDAKIKGLELYKEECYKEKIRQQQLITTLQGHLDRYRWVPVEEREPTRDPHTPAGWSVPCEVLTDTNILVSPAFYVNKEWIHFGKPVIDTVIMFREIREE